MDFQWSELVQRVRFYADDDHTDSPQEGWVGEAKYMQLLQLEYREQYRKWVRSGLIGPEPIDAEFTGSTAMVHATVPPLPKHLLYDGVLQVKTNGAAGNNVFVRFDDSGSGVGTLTEFLAGVDPLFLAGAVIFQFEPNVTSWQDFEAALATSGLLEVITPASVAGPFVEEDSVFTSGGADYLPRVLALLGVAEAVGECYRSLQAVTRVGRKPFYSGITGTATGYQVYGAGDNLTIKLFPRDDSGTYVARYLEVPLPVTDTSLTVELPYIADERLVLGALQRAGIKETSRLGMVSEAIARAEMELVMESAQRDKEQGMRVRNIGRSGSTPGSIFASGPLGWRY